MPFPVNVVGYYPATSIQADGQTLFDNTISDTGSRSVSVRFPFGNMRVATEDEALRSINLEENRGAASFWMAQGNTVFSTKHTGHAYMIRPGLMSMVTPAIAEAMGYVDLGTTLAPNMAKRMRTRLEERYQLFCWHKDQVSEADFGNLSDRIDALVLKELQRGNTELVLKKQSPSQLFRGNRLFLAKHRFESLVGTSVDMIVPHLIVGTDSNDWSFQANTVLNGVMRILYGNDVDTINTLWRVNGFNLDRLFPQEYLGLQGWTTLSGTDVDGPENYLPPAIEPMGATDFANLEKLDHAFFTPQGGRVLEIRKRTNAIAEERRLTDHQVVALSAEITAGASRIDEMFRDIARLQREMANKRMQLAENQLRLPNLVREQARLTQTHHALTEASSGLSEQLLEALRNLDGTSGEELVKYFANWGVEVRSVLLKRKSDGRQMHAQAVELTDLLSGDYQIVRLSFVTTKPRPMEVVDRSGRKMDENRICGPYECVVTDDTDYGLRFAYRLYSPNAVLGVEWSNLSNEPLVRIHPHHDMHRVDHVGQIYGRWIENPCLGELAPSLADAMRGGKLRLAVTGCLTYLNAAYGEDTWGSSYTWFPYEQNYSPDLTAEAQRTLVSKAGRLKRWSTRPTTYGRMVRFIVDEEQQLMLMQVSASTSSFSNRLFCRWIPMNGRTEQETITSVLSEVHWEFIEDNWTVFIPNDADRDTEEEATT